MDFLNEYWTQLITFIISLWALVNTKTVEQEKSKLRKNEIIFNKYCDAVFKFNQFYQKLLYEIIDKNLSSQEDLNYDFCDKTNLMSRFLSEFMGQYAPILEQDINTNLTNLKDELKNMTREEDEFSQKYARQTEYGYEIGGEYIQDWIETTKVDKYVKNILDKFNQVNQMLQSSLQQKYLKQ